MASTLNRSQGANTCTWRITPFRRSRSIHCGLRGGWRGPIGYHNHPARPEVFDSVRAYIVSFRCRERSGREALLFSQPLSAFGSKLGGIIDDKQVIQLRLLQVLEWLLGLSPSAHGASLHCIRGKARKDKIKDMVLTEWWMQAE